MKSEHISAQPIVALGNSLALGLQKQLGLDDCANIQQSNEVLNRRKGTSNRRIWVGCRLFQRHGDIKDQRRKVTV